MKRILFTEKILTLLGIPAPIDYMASSFAYGKGIKHGIKIDNIYVYDVTSTILHVFGLPIPNDVDGRVLREIFKPESEIARRKPIYADPYYYDKLRERMRLKSKIKDLNAEEESVSYKKVKYVNSC